MQKSTNLTKEQAGFLQINPGADLVQPWWVSSGLQPHHHVDGFNQHMNPNTNISQLGVGGEDQLQKSAGDKTNPDEAKNSENHQAKIAASSSVPEQPNGYFEIRLGQPMVPSNSSQPDQLYGLFPGYGPQTMGSMMMPMSLATDDGTVYVNPKQYHRILCRRKVRAKAALKLKAQLAIDKPYRHESRHRHAMRRPRGAGGRFLTSKELQSLNETPGNDKNSMMTMNKTLSFNHDHKQFSNPSRSSSSEVLQGDNGNLNSPTSKGQPNPSGSSEVTSVLYGRQLGWFQTENQHRPFHHQVTNSVVVEGREGYNGWEVAGADNGCCDFLKV